MKKNYLHLSASLMKYYRRNNLENNYGHLDADGNMQKGLKLTKEEVEVLRFIKQRDKKLNKIYEKRFGGK